MKAICFNYCFATKLRKKKLKTKASPAAVRVIWKQQFLDLCSDLGEEPLALNSLLKCDLVSFLLFFPNLQQQQFHHPPIIQQTPRP